jgi:hypothetical protein
MKARILSQGGYYGLTTRIGDVVEAKRCGEGFECLIEYLSGTQYYKSWLFFKPNEVEVIHENTDTIVETVITKFQQRSEAGIKKYGTTLDRNDLTEKEWFTHLQEELMDATLYVERILKALSERK